MTDGSGLAGVQRWLSHQAEEVALELVCAEHPGPVRGIPGRTVVRLSGCARELASHELVELLGLGARQVAVRLDGCAEIDDAAAHLAPIVALLRAGLVDRLTIEGVPPRSPLPDGGAGSTPEPVAPGDRGPRRRRAVLEAAAMPVSRRRLLGLGGPAGRELPPPSAEPHDRLVAAVRALVVPTAALAALASPTPHLVASGCTACGVCVQACPTDALSLRHGAGGENLSISTLLHRPAVCNGCALCVDLCPVDVLLVADRWPWSRLLSDDEHPVVTVTTALCARCSTSFPVASGEKLCPVCTYRRRNPFGSTLPPGAVLAPAAEPEPPSADR
ncbi:ATP-binding protein [Pengzhenrongella frigida]|uniref:ATP-binding protein n=1 Tax=Pengzhenrongella frigida TaxID=1259133 RepID=UPI0013EC4903|nr:4Fe-4S binding protein [Cellulomonas sp. HLT2-17]